MASPSAPHISPLHLLDSFLHVNLGVRQQQISKRLIISRRSNKLVDAEMARIVSSERRRSLNTFLVEPRETTLGWTPVPRTSACRCGSWRGFRMAFWTRGCSDSRRLPPSTSWVCRTRTAGLRSMRLLPNARWSCQRMAIEWPRLAPQTLI